MICVDKPHLANDENTVSIFWKKKKCFTLLKADWMHTEF